MNSVKSILAANLAAVEQRIGAACRQAGRDRGEVRLVAVTKYADIDAARALWELGVQDLAESRPQELWRKAEAIPGPRWHLVGHLQRNKVEKTLAFADLIHSVDSIRLLEAIETESRKRASPADVLLEFNLSGEPAKHGFSSQEIDAIIEALRPVQHVRVLGLMTMAALEADPQAARQTFAALRGIQNRLRAEVSHPVHDLSMGMTADFEQAIAEGATMVRIGSALFEGLQTIP